MRYEVSNGNFKVGTKIDIIKIIYLSKFIIFIIIIALVICIKHFFTHTINNV